MTLAAVPVSVGAIWAWLALATHLARAQPSLLRTLAIASGRAPLTQFIGQSLLFALLFNDSLIGWHGEVGERPVWRSPCWSGKCFLPASPSGLPAVTAMVH